MQLSKEANRQGVSRNYRGKIHRIHQFKKGLYGLAYKPTIFPKKLDRALEYCTLALLDDLKEVTHGKKKT